MAPHDKKREGKGEGEGGRGRGRGRRSAHYLAKRVLEVGGGDADILGTPQQAQQLGVLLGQLALHAQRVRGVHVLEVAAHVM